MRIAEKIEALQLRMNFTGGESVIHPALLWDSEGATLVDTGMPGQLGELRVEIEDAGVGPAKERGRFQEFARTM